MNRALLLELANSVGNADDLLMGIATFRNALLRLLPGVDRLSVNICRNAFLSVPASSHVIASAMNVNLDSDYQPGLVAFTQQHDWTGSTRFILALKKAGLPIDQYHEPICRDYYSSVNFYLGSILLWRLRCNPPIVQDVEARLDFLESFIRFAFVGMLSKYQVRHDTFIDAVGTIDEDIARADLSGRQASVLLLYFNGKSAAEIATALNIEECTVRRHMQTIRKRVLEHSGRRLPAFLKPNPG